MSATSLAAQLSSIADLEEQFENNAEQLRYWYHQLSELEVEELDARENLVTVFNAARLIMQYEHTNSEEMRELAEREAVEMADREENWEAEREALKEEISMLRERITSNAGFDEANEAFRAEIDSLTSQNAHLRQVGRERDRELADQRDRSEELGKRLEHLEKERSLFASNQSDLEEQIRELNRRINLKSDAPHRSDWESRRLRQRNEQAITLSNQLQSVIAQNDQLKMEVDRLSSALENATALIHENTSKYADYGEQLTFAERSIERLSADNKELKKQIAQREASLTKTSDQVELTSKEFGEILSVKDVQIEQLRSLIEKHELEIDELHAHVQYQQNDEREEELERLREELISATDTARKLFGAAMGANYGKGDSAEDGPENTVDPNAELRLRVVQLDKKLEASETRVNELQAINSEIENAMEQKDLVNARLNSENQKLREMTFGDADSEIRRLERQLEFRDRQIQELNRYCSLLQIELQQRIEAMETSSTILLTDDDVSDRSVIPKKGRRRRKGQIREVEKFEKQETTSKNEESSAQKRRVKFEDSDEVPETETKLIVDGEDNSKDSDEDVKDDAEIAVESGEADRTSEILMTANTQKMIPSKVVLKYKTIEPTVVMMNSLHAEIVRLNQDLERKQKELELEKILYKERENLLIDSKRQNEDTKKELEDLRENFFGDIPIEEILRETAEANLPKEDNLRNRVSELDLENMELQRLAENIRENGTEFERRMAEASRRLVFLTIQNSRLERRAETNERLRRTIAQEYGRLRTRLQRIVSGEERRSRQLMLENEVNLIEIARLQNTLLHSVPLTEYNRLQRKYKSLIQKNTVGSASLSDGGYHSGTATDDDIELADSAQFDISKTAMAAAAFSSRPSDSTVDTGDGRWADAILVKNKRLQEENDVLRSQIEFWQKEILKKDNEIEELNAFLGDIENETELKSMIVNIERRFLQTVREQFDNAQEQMQAEAETQTLRKQLQRRRSEWRAERQVLVNLALNLHNVLRKVNANRSNASSVSIEQLEALKNVMDSVKEREKLADQRHSQVEKEALELETKSAFLEACRTSTETIINNDYQLQYIQANLQGYQLNVLTLSAELRRVRDEADKWKRLASERIERCEELQLQLDEFNFCNIDLGFLAEIQLSNLRFERQHSGSRKELIKTLSKESELSRGNGDDLKRGLSLEDSSENSESSLLPFSTKDRAPTNNAQAIVIDNSEEYHRQIQALQNTARLCVRNFEEQLAQKDKAIEEYRLLLESLSSSAQSTELSKRVKNTKAESPPDFSTQLLHSIGVQHPKTSAELISAHDVVEKKDHRIFVLERELRALETANSALTDRLGEIEAASRTAKPHQIITKKKDAKVQVNLSINTSSEKLNASPTRRITEKSEETEKGDNNKVENDDKDENDDKYENGSEEEDEKNSTASHASSSNASSSNVSESGSNESETDSGTVEDIDNRPQRRSSAHSTSTLNGSHSSSEKIVAATRRPATATQPRILSIASQQRPSAGTGARRAVSAASTTTNAVEDVETIVLRHRNETRRLRMRIIALERKNKQISDENESLKERGRFAARRPLDPNSEANIARKENERLQRENKNLAKSLQTQKDEFEALQKSLKKSESLVKNKIASDVWEERKRHSLALKSLKQQISRLEASEAELRERLARREKFIEQSTRNNSQKFDDAQKLTRLQSELREERALFEKRELTHQQETNAWTEKYRDFSTRLEMLVKENKTLHARNVGLQERLRNQPPQEPQPKAALTRNIDKKNVATQTSYIDHRSGPLGKITLAQAQQQSTSGKLTQKPIHEKSPSANPFEGSFEIPDSSERSGRIELIGEIKFTREKGINENRTVERSMTSQTMVLPGGVLSPIHFNTGLRSTHDDHDHHVKSETQLNALTKQMRRAKLLQVETAEQLESMKKAYEELLNNYKGLLRADLERKREREESAAVAVLRDKLVGKDHEIDQQRHKIVDLERKLWNLQMER